MTRTKRRPQAKPKSSKHLHNKGGEDDRDKDGNHTEHIEKEDMHNARFEAYYRAQNIIESDEEWEEFMAAMRRPLPTTFRVAGSRMTAHTLNKTITDTYVPLLSDAEFEGEKIPPPSQIHWYPEGLAWQFNVSKKVLRKSPEFKKFHSFLVFETEVGNVSRQEAVSMLPPLFMDVEPHHIVLDMCAAPGSKTAQILEALHLTDTPSCTTTPPGLLIANDSDQKRCHLLVHQSARIGSPSLMVTNLDASIYPAIRVPSSIPSPVDKSEEVGLSEIQILRRKRKQAQKHPNAEVPTSALLFDRILCDVPCSGDGTMRKNLGIWKRWGVGDGNGLHGLQLRILQRAMKMLKADGRIVYSTCSLNPVENEAVVAAALLSNEEFELVDVSARLPSLIRRPGLKKWTPVPSEAPDTLGRFATYQEYLASLDDEGKARTKMSETHWSPPEGVAEALHLSRCMRVYPHSQDTGGFFISVLQRKSVQSVVPIDVPDRKRDAGTPINAPDAKRARLEDHAAADRSIHIDDTEALLEAHDDSAKEQDVDLEEADMDDVEGLEDDIDAVTASTDKPQKTQGKGKEKGNGGFKENPYTYISPDDPILTQCITRLNFSASFPSSNVLVRNAAGEAVRSLYITNPLIKTIVEHNDYTRLRIVNCGTKVLTKQDGGRGMEPSFRILGEGLPVVLPYIEPETILEANTGVLRTLLSVYYPLCAAFKEPFKGVAEALEAGSQIIRLPPGDWDGVTLTHELVLPIWKSNVSLTLMIDKKAKSALSLRLFGEDVTIGARDAAAERRANALPPTAANGDENDIVGVPAVV
ncbi:hypothetical protein HWV62_13980 [Athelia sp. TMB]|nr:hypothetical protein HWV62_13980 [Athelia sp. TMB]